MKKVITGNMAVAIGAKLCRPEVIAIYPITPQTTIVEYASKMVADGELAAECIKVESEHSAMAACIGAAAVGCRVFTATSSHGLALMHEMLFQASGLRLPVVMVNVNRALGAPWCVYTDQSDSLAQRDTGWVQLYAENSQEVLDMIPQSYKIGETMSLPVMVVSEGFILSHTAEPVEIPDQEKIDDFLGPYQPKWELDLSDPRTYGGTTKPADYAAMKRSVQEAMERVIEIQKKVAEEYFAAFGRHYPAVEFFGPSAPEILVVTSGTTSGTSREVITEKYNDKVALMKIRMFRPFPEDIVREMCRLAGKIAIIDRNISVGSRGIFSEAIRSALQDSPSRPPIFEFILGIGGMDITPEIISKVIDYVSEHRYPANKPIWQKELEELE